MADKQYHVAAFCSDLNEDNDYETDWHDYTGEAVIGEVVGEIITKMTEHRFSIAKYEITVCFKEKGE